MSNTLLDEELLSSYLSHLGKDIIKQMIDLYQQQSKIYLDDINQAAIEQSPLLWETHCHKMKGAAGSVGLKVLHSYLLTIENSDASREDKLLMIIKLREQNDTGVTAFIFWLNAV
jgi:HPt (histidine-containing phosphotransfer) domain-containing protein|tara:strand:+ start:260 stop:604 length:345 start_codon:yes stop_codon:yes gene_type:complete